MGLLKVDTCCVCVSLDVGTKIIGVVFTVFAAMSAALYAVPVARLSLPPATAMFYSTAFITSVVQFIAGCVMIVGVFQKRPPLMWPWLALAWAVGAALLALACAGAALLYSGAGAPHDNYVASAYAVYALVLLYFAAVVRSRREEILDEIKWDSCKRLMRPVALNENIYV